MVGGQGIHAGLTSIFECLVLGYAETSAQALRDSTTVSLDGKSYGKIGRLIRDRNNDPELFVPFQNRLKVQDVEENDTESVEEPKKKRGKK